MRSTVNLILMGPPGAGKGTQATRLCAELKVPKISTGEILRENVRDSTKLGHAAQGHMDAGQLVPDHLIVEMAMERLDRPDTHSGFVLDGFPRTTIQAQSLADRLGEQGRAVSGALLIEVSDATIVERVAGRRVCAQCGHSYHVDYDPPRNPNRCDDDDALLIQRDDDKAEVIRRRLTVYHEQTSPLISYYGERNLLHRVDGTLSPSQVYRQIETRLAALPS